MLNSWGLGGLPGKSIFSVMKKTLSFLTVALMLNGLQAYGQDNVQFLNVTANSMPVSYGLADAPIITFVNDQMIIKTASGTVTNPLSNVQKWTFSAKNVMVHDVNDDGRIDINDAFCITNYLVGKPNPKFIREAADVDGDGEVSIVDATRIIDLVTGK